MPNTKHLRRYAQLLPFRLTVAAVAASIPLSLAVCVSPGQASDATTPNSVEMKRPERAADETAEGFDLEALIEAAKKEGPISIYDETGKVVSIAEAFTKKYGIEAHGIKIETGMLDKVAKENQSDNVIGDVVASQEIPAIYSELLADGVLTSWVPGDLYDSLPQVATYPFLNMKNLAYWVYNSETYGDACPITNIWELTEAKWKGKVAIPDPESRAIYTTAWSQAARVHAKDYADAYKKLYGTDLDTDQPTAVHEWLKRLAQNEPLVFKNDEEISEAVGASGQKDPPFGFIWAAKLRNNREKGFHNHPCAGMVPFAGISGAQAMSYATKSKNPHAAKLYIHFATSREGMAFIMPDGKASYSPDLKPVEDPNGAFVYQDQTQPYATDNLADDYTSTMAWQDLWRSNR